MSNTTILHMTMKSVHTTIFPNPVVLTWPVPHEIRAQTANPVSLSAAPPTKARVTMETHQVTRSIFHATTSLSTSCSGIQNMLSAQTRRFVYIQYEKCHSIHYPPPPPPHSTIVLPDRPDTTHPIRHTPN